MRGFAAWQAGGRAPPARLWPRAAWRLPGGLRFFATYFLFFATYFRFFGRIWNGLSVLSGTACFGDGRRHMARAISDPAGKRPTSVTTFFDGRCPVCMGAVARYKRVAREGRPDLLWRDIRRFPEALATFGVSRAAARRRIHVVDRSGALRAGVDGMIVIWRELPRRRWRAVLLSAPGIHGLAGLLYDRLFAPILIAWSQARAPETGADGPSSADLCGAGDPSALVPEGDELDSSSSEKRALRQAQERARAYARPAKGAP
jgi:predicted DCC family thiol-disulfide oxidoreductase YuxK